MRFKNKLELIFTRETSKQHQSSEEPVLLHTYIIHATCTSINERSKRKQGKQGKASLSLSLSSSNSQGDVSLQDFCSTRSRGCRIFFFIKESPPVVESAPIMDMGGAKLVGHQSWVPLVFVHPILRRCFVVALWCFVMVGRWLLLRSLVVIVAARVSNQRENPSIQPEDLSCFSSLVRFDLI